MNNVLYYLSGGFLKGYRTYIIMAVGMITLFAGWAVGDITTADAVNSLLALLGLGTAAHHEPKK
jgi:hypothetical protein